MIPRAKITKMIATVSESVRRVRMVKMESNAVRTASCGLCPLK